jgi:two-component system, cell cycle response regulator
MAGHDDDGTTNINIVPVVVNQAQKAGYLMVVSSGAESVTGQMFKLTEGEMVIGRAANADVRIDDDGVSRRHAKLVALGDARFRLVDLDSRNGTFVNGERVTDTELNDGDRVQVGSTAVLLFSLQDELEEQFTRRLYESATHDALTRLLNKKYFVDAVEKEISFCIRYKSPLSLIMIDVDHFKLVNDVHGHLAGDQVLTRVAARLLQLTRNEDVLARYGGEEFVTVLRNANLRAAQICAERYRAAIEGLAVPFNDSELRVTISAGLVSAAGHERLTRERMIEQADACLYQAKHAGRNRVIAAPYQSE